MLIPEQSTWKIIDSSKLQCFLTCPRMYFYNYILGWKKDEPNIHLKFGEAWHLCMEILLQKGYNTNAIVSAVESFSQCFNDAYPAGQTDFTSPKSMANIPEALVKYCQNYQGDAFPGNPALVKHTEIAGTVPISEDRVLHFRLDSLIEDEKGRMFALEHKTGSRNDRNWQDQWSLSLQVFTYLHVLHCLYTPEKVYGVLINGAFFQKTGVTFLRVPIRKNMDMLQSWLSDVNHFLDLLELYQEQLCKTTMQDQIMEAYPKNPTNCTKYFGCPFLGMCSSWANPIAHCLNGPPPGFTEDHWNPADYTAKPCNKVINL